MSVQHLVTKAVGCRLSRESPRTTPGGFHREAVMQVHEAIVAVLRDVGVDVIFGGAGEESMGMQIAVARAEGVRGIIPKHEQNASFMACGYALLSGKLGVCFSTAGPGAFNLMSGVCV